MASRTIDCSGRDELRLARDFVTALRVAVAVDSLLASFDVFACCGCPDVFVGERSVVFSKIEFEGVHGWQVCR
jgi:hypothetical protein